MVKWGVLGAARIAREQVIPAIRRSGAGEVLAVSSASGKAGPYAKELGVARAYDSHEQLLADPDVDVVYIALPNSVHAQWIVAAADAGKHVLCEKPLVIGTAELDRVDHAARSAGVHVVEAFMYRYHPQLAQLHELLAGDAIGELVTVQARLHFSLDRAGERDIRLRPDLGGGSLLDLGCYPVDLLGLLLGRDPEEVFAVAHREESAGVDTRLAAVLRYGSVVASLDCGFDSPFVNTAVLIGTKGRIELTDVFRADREGGVGTIQVVQDVGTQTLRVPGDQYAEEVRHVAQLVQGAADGRENADLSRRTARTLERIAQAAGLA
jgi:predicted dehydrogenase